MSRGTGTHFGSPVLAGDGFGGGLYEDVPVEILSRIHRMGYFTDFNEPGSDASATNLMIATAVGAGAAQSAAIATSGAVAAGGVFQVAGGTTASTGEQAQACGTGVATTFAPFLPSSSTPLDAVGTQRTISFGARIGFSAAASAQNSDWFVGLAGVDTSLMATTGALTTPGFDNGVGFHHVLQATAQGGLTGPDATDVRFAAAAAGVGNYQAVLASAANVSKVAVGGAPFGVTTYVDVGVKIRGLTSVEFYWNGMLRHRMTLTSSLSTTVGMVPSFTVISNGTARTMNVDYFWVSQTR